MPDGRRTGSKANKGAKRMHLPQPHQPSAPSQALGGNGVGVSPTIGVRWDGHPWPAGDLARSRARQCFRIRYGKISRKQSRYARASRNANSCSQIQCNYSNRLAGRCPLRRSDPYHWTFSLRTSPPPPPPSHPPAPLLFQPAGQDLECSSCRHDTVESGTLFLDQR